ncbi:hypothetical protein LMH87_004633 [Akanthomyces muscarius]|uniref:Uncharacterized protein n=1 Tax=Akanthomyces muscarius TaxID=2231603 RepID=A0A9W8UHU9_AKAMU|nr:hypothetical protein LMH87_004633 [Akanthomyces muscarius]KAJ4145798.1 hypothetical protein LMH87_004633 [Akanthomyces muscarius]
MYPSTARKNAALQHAERWRVALRLASPSIMPAAQYRRLSPPEPPVCQQQLPRCTRIPPKHADIVAIRYCARCP